MCGFLLCHSRLHFPETVILSEYEACPADNRPRYLLHRHMHGQVPLFYRCSMVLNSGPQDYPASSLVSCKRAHMFVSFVCLIFMNTKSCPYCYKWQIFIFFKNWIGFYCECLLVLCHFKWEWFSVFCPYNYACILWFKRPLYGKLLFYLVSNFNI